MTVKASGPIKPGSTDAHESQVSDLLTRMMTVETCFQRKKINFKVLHVDHRSMWGTDMVQLV